MRPTEVKAITALLEDEHPDVEALAKTVIQTLDELRSTRGSFVVRLQWDDTNRFGVGPFANANEAYKAAKRIAPLATEEQLRGSVAALMPPTWWQTEAPSTAKGSCPDCGHPTITHDWPKYKKKRRGCVVTVAGEHCYCEGSGK